HRQLMPPRIPELRKSMQKNHEVVVVTTALRIVQTQLAHLRVVKTNRLSIQCGLSLHKVPVVQPGPSARASSSAISISILSNAVENVLPCASVIKESVPPPPRLSCKRKFRAPRLGNSNRSTLPLQMPVKCLLTRSAVTSRTSKG